MGTFFGVLITSFFMFLVLAGQVWAAGSGAYRIEVGDAGASGKGSAFVGEANTPAAVYYNPAGLTQIKGQAVSVGACLIQPKVNYESNTGNKTKMQQDSFLIPSLYYVTDLGGKNWALGIGTLSSWGLGTEWAQDSFARYTTTRAKVQTEDYLITGAYQVNDQVSVGLGLVINDAKVDKEKKLLQGSTGDGNLRLKGDSTGAGFVVSSLYKVNEKHQFGFIYRSAIQHKYRGKIYLDDLNADTGVLPAGQSYSGAFAGGGSSYHTDVISKSTLPDNIVLGYSYKPDQKWTFNADLEWMNWSVNNDEEIAYPSETSAFRQAVLTNSDTATPRDWDSVISAALGTEYAMSDRLRLRGGYFFRQSPIPGDNWEPNLPDSNSNAVTTGFGYDIRKDLTLDFAWCGIFYNKKVIDNTVGDTAGGGTTNIDGIYTQWDNLVYATMTYKF